MCGSCGGIGQAEPLTERMNKRMAPLLAILLTISLLLMIASAAVFKSTYFSELLAFGSAIIGAVVGFYFSNNRETL
jgi:positive regulator of sigma E activity